MGARRDQDGDGDGSNQNSAAVLGSWFLSGLLASLGIGLGGMSHNISLGFFDLGFSGRHGPFNLTLLIVFMCACLPPLVLHHLVKLPRKPLLTDRFQFNKNPVIDVDVVVGSLLFGFGWAVGGFCPGPSIVGLVTGHPNYVVHAMSMLLGMLLHNVWRDRSTTLAEWLPSVAVVALPSVFLFVGPRLFPMDHAPVVESWPVVESVLGGLLIGTGSITLLLLTGNIMGLSGIWKDAVAHKNSSLKLTNLMFFVGMLVGGILLYYTAPQTLSHPVLAGRFSLWTIFVGGAIGGFGVAMAKGCTSGHGVAGMPRFVPRSIVAVAMFMGGTFAAATALSYLGY